ncbi:MULTISPECIES: GntR family transcriptional regulator [Alphaproteobacteria]|uniref:GntR family transcriptional regulator n=2 Tax=Alphaproteobacteria TaxID=28211 RepID=A0A512HH38_9HYPH|nr:MULTISPECIES: GntR family transcriptional regulator [Alphaproteobacteria]GEO84767.1 GntR family transcriptional regulator [Ciceribacter naphthalenivorans]GLR20612.1 GntR family transcriptional regulator [Ciceribacter naphthalenivorans]GLT03468.1 GntR family transcriptional regulator [Sphingomonas psychrolutea]
MSSDGINQTHRAIMALRERILSGAVEPGGRLYEVPLARELDLSRTPLREALSRLEQEGLLERGVNGGYTVRRFTVQDAIDAIELRGVLEGMVVRMAAERGVTAAGLSRLQGIVLELDDVVAAGPDLLDIDRYADLNNAFHDGLLDLVESDLMKREVQRSRRLPFASPNAFLVDDESVMAFRASLAGAQAQHRGIVEAIGAREGTRAEALAREHTRPARRNLDCILKHDRRLVETVPGLRLVVL